MVQGSPGCMQAEQAARKRAEELLKASELREKEATAAFQAQAADKSAIVADRATLDKDRQDLQQMQSDIVDELRRVRSELQAAQQALNGTATLLDTHSNVAFLLETMRPQKQPTQGAGSQKGISNQGRGLAAWCIVA